MAGGTGAGLSAIPGDEVGEVRLEVPATPDLVRLARLTASGLASRLSYPFDAVEDIRLAVDELCWAVAGKAGPGGRLTVRLRVAAGAALEVEARVVAVGGPAPILSPMSEVILATLVAEVETLSPADGLGPGLRLLTRPLTAT